MTTAFEVREAALVTHVAHAIVPVDVIVPPVIGDVVAIEVTVPLVVLHVEQVMFPVVALMARGEEAVSAGAEPFTSSVLPNTLRVDEPEVASQISSAPPTSPFTPS